MKTRLVLRLLVAILFTCIRPAGAQDIAPNRPGISTPSEVLPPGTQNLEMGLSLVRFKDGTSNLFSSPSLFRVGLNGTTELRIGSNFLTLQGSQTGLSDVVLATKWNFRPSGGPSGTSFGLLSQVEIPSGSSPFRAGGGMPSVTLLADGSFSPKVGWVANLGAASLVDPAGGQRFLQGQYSVLVTRTVSKKVWGFVEVAGYGPDKPGGTTQWMADTGFGILVNPRLQLDVSVLKGLTPGAPDWSLGLGISMKR